MGFFNVMRRGMWLDKFSIPASWRKFLWTLLSLLLAPVLSDVPGKLAPQLEVVLTQTQWLRVTTASFVLLLAYIVYLINEMFWLPRFKLLRY
jgi:hypothetical protein